MTAPPFTLSSAWQAFEKLPRPLLRWVSIAAFIWICGGCDVAGYPLDSINRAAILAAVLSIYGIRAVERIKGAVA